MMTNVEPPNRILGLSRLVAAQGRSVSLGAAVLIAFSVGLGVLSLGFVVLGHSWGAVGAFIIWIIILFYLSRKLFRTHSQLAGYVNELAGTTIRITLDEKAFRDLVSGEAVELEGVEFILADIGVGAMSRALNQVIMNARMYLGERQ